MLTMTSIYLAKRCSIAIETPRRQPLYPNYAESTAKLKNSLNPVKKLMKHKAKVARSVELSMLISKINFY